jgi:hypothetical protein
VRACVRACVRAGGAWSLAWLAVAGCADEEVPAGADVGSAQARLTGPDASAAMPHCAGKAVFAGHEPLHYIDRTLQVYACVAPGPEVEVLAYDAETGRQVDRAALKEENRQALQDGARLHHTLSDRIQHLGPDEPVDVAIWLRVDTSDLGDPWDRRNDRELAAWAHAEQEQRRRTSAQSLATNLAGFAGAVVRSNVDAETIGIPVVFAEVPKRHLTALGDLPGVNLIMPGSPDRDMEPLSTLNYFDSNVAGVHHLYEWTGDGVVVAVHEGARPDTYWNLPGILPGDCVAPGGSASCHCPGGSMTGHPRWVAGLIGNSVTPFGGIAPDASLIFANRGSCTSHGPDPTASAVNWATDEGASVINVSAIMGDLENMFYDYKAAHYPYPTVVAGAGNAGHLDLPVANKIRNGLVVGASTDNHIDYATDTRHDIEIKFNSSWINPEGFGELPHVAAPGGVVATAGAEPGEVAYGPNTSASTPQVAGAVACLQEQDPDLKWWPEVLTSVLMVGADINADAAEDGVWPLDLHDDIDDRDGAGQINMYYSGFVVFEGEKKPSPSVPHSPLGYGKSTMYQQSNPPGTCHYAWRVHVPAGEVLRAHSMVMSDPNCETGIFDCVGNPYAETLLALVDEGQAESFAYRADQNWQYLSWVNDSGVGKDMELTLCLIDWNGLEYAYYALSWLTLEPLASPVP